MKRAVVMIACLLLTTVAFTQEVDLPGVWHLYRVDTIGSYSLSEFRTGAPTRSFVDATLELDADGLVVSDSPALRFISWRMEENGFLAFETPSGNAFYRIRDLTPDVLFLVSVVVTERNAIVTQIEVNQNANLVLVRAN